MESDSIRYVKKCHRCQIHGDFIRVLPNELNIMGSPRPFAAWGMNAIGSIEPTVSNGHHFILVGIDYFTKWVEASTYKAVTKKVMAGFVHNNIVSKFGIPESIITDNVANINNDLTREICKRQWNEKLSTALLGYRTTMRKSIGETPYMLVYGTEAVIPSEVKIASLRVVQEAELDDA
ncbi:uncharacterized protein LOC142171751 [Nicotiana tabacum]|uniref:Uncharacterized protein LOC142171751 n=1 Tax=Nicotiana tabacum TaxID=4097 RepID=A0AC58T2W4_TOBAC